MPELLWNIFAIIGIVTVIGVILIGAFWLIMGSLREVP